MAIQGVKGAPGTYYVIKGNTDPNTVAQYWSSLVTNQKKEMFNNALKVAMKEADQAQDVTLARQKAYDKTVSDLAKQKQKLSAEIRKLDVKATDAAQRLEEKAAGKTTTREAYVDTQAGGGTRRGKGDDYEKLKKRRTDLALEIGQLQTQRQALGNSPLGRGVDTQINEAELEKKRLDKKLKEMETKGLDKPQAGTTTTTEARDKKKVELTSTTKPTDLPDAPDYADQIAALEAELEAINQQEAALRAPTARTVDVLDRTRELMGRPTLGFAPEEEARLAARTAEMERRMFPQRSVSETLPPITAESETAFVDTLTGPEREGLFEPGGQTLAQMMADEDAQEAARQRSEANFQPNAFTQMAARELGEVPDAELQRALAEEDQTFDEYNTMKAELAKEREANLLAAQEAGRAEAEANRAAFPEFQDFPEEARPIPQDTPAPMIRQEMEGMNLEKYLEALDLTEVEKDSLKIPDPRVVKEQKTERLIKHIEAGANKTRAEAKQLSEQANEADDYRSIVKQLYSAGQGTTADKRVKARDNAYQQLEKAYGDDKETFDKAVELLITLDALEMGTLPE